MRIIITGIIILIFLIFLFILYQYSFNNKVEKFTASTTNYDTIETLIDDNMLPSNPNQKIQLTEYDIISIFKTILERTPTSDEMNKFAYFDTSQLKEYLFNSPEYDKLIRIQDNRYNNDVESSIAKKNLLTRIMKIYKVVYKKDAPDAIVEPLKDCFIHLQLNDYLFISMLENINYISFETEVLSTYVLSKKVLLDLFNKYFNVLELKMISQQKINNINNMENDIDNDITTIKEDILKVKDVLSKDIDLNDFIKNTFPNVFNVLLKSAVSDSELLDDKEKIKHYLSIIEHYKNTTERLEMPDKTQEKIQKLPQDTELYYRIYDPIDYKATNRDVNKRPPICTSLGQPQLTQPIFTESKLLFQGTDYDKAFEETQIGSIMPKFIYKEYQDVKIN
uniref:Uncharacterized protein n=1 Tax=viral metagenome TaxID=1070528 RepID=A0A6C0CH59_9ZZZZ